ncbi:PREDICTED: uncharacterized protein LOC106806992 [Priapulus caudatus]|uniref:Uncharacterized protein LOC106806992 n=1 Tax=Priapulus caudatus TaxID=37621 RepID=A0ABM1DXK2_PRICU|nr:PREDICTED: uncharacterized protein LOC106806992 [Priapulus caudatus]
MRSNFWPVLLLMTVIVIGATAGTMPREHRETYADVDYELPPEMLAGLSKAGTKLLKVMFLVAKRQLKNTRFLMETEGERCKNMTDAETEGLRQRNYIRWQTECMPCVMEQCADRTLSCALDDLPRYEPDCADIRSTRNPADVAHLCSYYRRECSPDIFWTDRCQRHAQLRCSDRVASCDPCDGIAAPWLCDTLHHSLDLQDTVGEFVDDAVHWFQHDFVDFFKDDVHTFFSDDVTHFFREDIPDLFSMDIRDFFGSVHDSEYGFLPHGDSYDDYDDDGFYHQEAPSVFDQELEMFLDETSANIADVIQEVEHFFQHDFKPFFEEDFVVFVEEDLPVLMQEMGETLEEVASDIEEGMGRTANRIEEMAQEAARELGGLWNKLGKMIAGWTADHDSRSRPISRPAAGRGRYARSTSPRTPDLAPFCGTLLQEGEERKLACLYFTRHCPCEKEVIAIDLDQHCPMFVKAQKTYENVTKTESWLMNINPSELVVRFNKVSVDKRREVRQGVYLAVFNVMIAGRTVTYEANYGVTESRFGETAEDVLMGAVRAYKHATIN